MKIKVAHFRGLDSGLNEFNLQQDWIFFYTGLHFKNKGACIHHETVNWEQISLMQMTRRDISAPISQILPHINY